MLFLRRRDISNNRRQIVGEKVEVGEVKVLPFAWEGLIGYVPFFCIRSEEGLEEVWFGPGLEEVERMDVDDGGC